MQYDPSLHLLKIKCDVCKYVITSWHQNVACRVLHATNKTGYSLED
jgi:hypothetical protein